VPLHRDASVQRADDLGRAQSRRRSEVHSWTEDGRLRAPVFLRLREDIDPKAVRRAKAPEPEKPARGSGEIEEVVQQLETNKRAQFTARRRPATRSSSRISIASTGRRTRRSISLQ
jgi:hypothetical protein